jgi:hypothetical protein
VWHTEEGLRRLDVLAAELEALIIASEVDESRWSSTNWDEAAVRCLVTDSQRIVSCHVCASGHVLTATCP